MVLPYSELLHSPWASGQDSPCRHYAISTSPVILSLRHTAPPSNPDAESASTQRGYPQTSGSESTLASRNIPTLGLLEIVYTIPRACLIGSNSAGLSPFTLKHLHDFKWNFWCSERLETTLGYADRTRALGESIHAVKRYWELIMCLKLWYQP